MSLKTSPSQRKLRLESLETRDLFASIGYDAVADVVTVYGDDWSNSVTVKQSGNKVTVRIESTPSTGFSLVPNIVTRDFAALSDVDQIKFYGNAGNDSFVSYLTNVPVVADGGSGNDYLESYNGVDDLRGGDGNDTIKAYGGNDTVRGGAGNDVIYGGSGNDNLYGGNDDDKVYGDSGNDGLYGGAGTDLLYGGAGSDRFLIMSGQTEHKDAVTEDATIIFKNGNKTWNASEIEAVDQALALLHNKTGNDNLLELKSGAAMTFERHAAKGTVLGDNNSAGLIRLYDSAFSSDARAAATTVHEMAHNWDTEHSNYTAWQKISGWTTTRQTGSNYAKSGDGEWYYLKSASFSTSYAKTNPREDFAEAMQNYFTDKGGLSNIESMSKLSAAKTAHLDKFFASLS